MPEANATPEKESIDEMDWRREPECAALDDNLGDGVALAELVCHVDAEMVLMPVPSTDGESSEDSDIARNDTVAAVD